MGVFDIFKKSNNLEKQIVKYQIKSFEKNAYRKIQKSDLKPIEELLKKAYPNFLGKVLPFGVTWLGNILAIDLRENNKGNILLFDIGIDEIIEIQCDIKKFFTVILKEDADKYLLLSLYKKWLNNGGEEANATHCINCKNYRIFDTEQYNLSNLGYNNLYTYWNSMSRIIERRIKQTEEKKKLLSNFRKTVDKNIKFIKLNTNWDIAPNAPMEEITVKQNDVELEFLTNYNLKLNFKSADEYILLTFKDCLQYRYGEPNDEGFNIYGESRFVQYGVEWGHFYLVENSNWKNYFPEAIPVSLQNEQGLKHFLIYFRDATFECIARDYEMKEYKIVKVKNLKTKEVIELKIYESENKENGNFVMYTEIKNQNILASSDGYFDCYQKLRDKLLEKGYGLLCIGSKINAVQSPMASVSDKIYLVEKGQPAKNVQSLYEFCDMEVFPNTEEQNNFYEEWINSLNKGKE